MKEFKGTKGEWKAEKPKWSNGFWYVNNELNNSGAIATCYNVFGLETDLETEANAKLIASAPELLEVLQEAVNIQKENYGNGMNTHLALSSWVKRAEKAIEKALN